jgi:RHS repeat-associated protein
MLDPGAARHQPLRLAGQYADAETGLHYNRYRFYDPETGHYLTPDPIGIDGGLNAYAYCSDPLNVVDPLGLTITTLQKMGKMQPGVRRRIARRIRRRKSARRNQSRVSATRVEAVPSTTIASTG